MYQVSNSTAMLRAHRRLWHRGKGETGDGVRVHRTVVLLGLTSLFTDIASEMVVAVLPLYLVYVGGFSPLAVGIIDGIYQGATALMGIFSAYIGDRFRKHKEVAATGYGLSAFCKLGLATVGTAMGAIGAVILADRAGKGMRTAPRDAMISLSTPKEELGMAFGVHRAMDTTGAMLGPLVAFGILAISPLAFEELFMVSFCFAMIGFGILVLLVETPSISPEVKEEREPRPAPSIKGGAKLLKVPRFRALMVAGGLLSLATVSDAFVFLTIEDQMDLGTTLFPLLFVANSAIFMILAVPFGRLADRIGRARVLVGGYTLLIGVYALLLMPGSSSIILVAALGLFGAYYAATDGVLMAVAAPNIPEEMRGTGLAMLRTTTDLGRLFASVLFGILWTVWSLDSAIVFFMGAMVVALLATAFVLVRNPEPAVA